MTQGLVHIHNFLRWIVLILLVIAVFKHLMGMVNRKSFTNGDRKLGSFLMISTHIQFLVGLFLYFAGDLGLKLIQNSGMGVVMKDSVARYWAVEHLVGMLIAIVLITIGKGVAKKNISDKLKHTRSFWYYFIALIIILVLIPWPFREGIARPLFPGM